MANQKKTDDTDILKSANENILALRLQVSRRTRNITGFVLLSGAVFYIYKANIITGVMKDALSLYFQWGFATVLLWLISNVLILYFRIQRERKRISEIADIQVKNLQETIDADFFTNLVKINFKYIDKYYLQTQLQADKSFTLSVTASLISFCIIVSGIVLMYHGSINSSIVATSAGIVSEFIAAVFFYLYNKTISKMGEYHHKLVLTQNISLALKITEQMEGELKTKAQLQLIEQLTKDINLHIASRPTD